MQQAQILVAQLPQKGKTTHPVRDGVKHLQIDPLLVIGHTEHVVVVLVPVDQAARIIIFLVDARCRFAVLLQIVPEYPASHPQVKPRKLGQHQIDRLLQKLRVNRLRHHRLDAVGIGHLLVRNDREDISGVVQPLPMSVFFSHDPFPAIVNNKILLLLHNLRYSQSKSSPFLETTILFY